MEIIDISEQEANDFSSRDESHFFDRKSLQIKPNKVQKLVVALANSDGGEIIVGIADDKDEPDINQRWQGASTIEEFNGLIQALTEITPTVNSNISFLRCGAKPGLVLYMQVEKSSYVHKTPDNTVYLRVSAQSIPIKEPEKILALSYAKGTASYEDQISKGAIAEDIVETEEIKKFLQDISPKTDPLTFALKQNLIDRNTYEPKVAGVLLFNENPSTLLAVKCAVKVARYETREEEPEREHLKETFTIEGPLYNQIHATIDKITELMSSVSIWTIDGLKNVEYPPEAIWEIIVNAIIHRDYAISDDIIIYVYDNRIEVQSPGKLPSYVTVDNILDSRYSRNPKIVRILNRYKSAPNKDMGEGLNTAFQKMKEWKLKDPIITEGPNTVKVIIPHTPLATPEEAILEFLQKNKIIRNRQARDITGIKSENAIKKVFYKLRDESFIERVPGLEGSAAAWRLQKN